MGEFKNLKLDVEDEIAVLTISRPAALNALNSETLDELNVALTEIEARDDVKVLILTGGPDKKGNEFKSFVAGADIAEMVNFSAAEARAFGMRASVPFFKLMNMRQVTIAAVNGFALGGGCEISMACDIRIASENASFGQPETGLGIIPGFGGTQRLARLVGMGRAKEMIFTCDSVDAQEAYRIGLVNKVVAKEELMDTAKAMAKKICSKGSYAVSVAKAAINNGYDMDIKNAVEMEANLFGVACSTHDKTGKLKILNVICRVYLTVIRGTPTMVQLLIVFYVIFATIDPGKIVVAIIAFGMNSAAYVAEIVRSGIMSIDQGQFEAGRSLGLNYTQTMIKIILPQAVKNILPALGNELIVLLKETSISGYIGLMDLTRGGDIIRSQTYSALFPLLVVAAIYLVIVCFLTYLVGRLERRLRTNERK